MMSGVQVDTIWRCTKSVSKHQGEENPKMCGSQDTALLYFTVNLEEFIYFSIKANCDERIIWLDLAWDSWTEYELY